MRPRHHTHCIRDTEDTNIKLMVDHHIIILSTQKRNRVGFFWSSCVFLLFFWFLGVFYEVSTNKGM